MFTLECCMCGLDLASRITEAIETELNRRQRQIEDGFPWPIIGIMCAVCEADARKLIG